MSIFVSALILLLATALVVASGYLLSKFLRPSRRSSIVRDKSGKISHARSAQSGGAQNFSMPAPRSDVTSTEEGSVKLPAFSPDGKSDHTTSEHRDTEASNGTKSPPFYPFTNPDENPQPRQNERQECSGHDAHSGHHEAGAIDVGGTRKGARENTPDVKTNSVAHVSDEDNGHTANDVTSPNSDINVSTNHKPGDVAGEETQSCDETSGPAGFADTPPNKGRTYRDRRGGKRVLPSAETAISTKKLVTLDVLLRLTLDSFTHRVKLAMSLSRPANTPEQVVISINNTEVTVGALDSSQYDDINLEIEEYFLRNEIRINSKEGLCWVRSARPIHLFLEHPTKAGWISCGTAKNDCRHVILCEENDANDVCEIAISTGSPPLKAHPNWGGIPAGWAVYSDFIPRHSARLPLDPKFSVLDPKDLDPIKLLGGLEILRHVYAEGDPPRIEISLSSANTQVYIDECPAKLSEEDQDVAGWEAPGWDAPGQHTINVVPGRSMTYRVMEDPASTAGWEFFNTHKLFESDDTKPWAQARICGAALEGPTGQSVLSLETQHSIIGLGQWRTVVYPASRKEISTSVALLSAPLAFLIKASGPRRTQGSITWLGVQEEDLPKHGDDLAWALVVCAIAARHLPFTEETPEGRESWNRAVAHAKQTKRRLRR